jgi:hypothetical protein
MEQNAIKYQGAEQLLPPEIREYLSSDAIKLYVKIWNLMNRKACNEIWISDAGASIGARVDYDKLHLAKQQLEDVGLLAIKPGRWPMEDAANVCNRYSFVADKQTATQ